MTDNMNTHEAACFYAARAIKSLQYITSHHNMRSNSASANILRNTCSSHIYEQQLDDLDDYMHNLFEVCRRNSHDISDLSASVNNCSGSNELNNLEDVAREVAMNGNYSMDSIREVLNETLSSNVSIRREILDEKRRVEILHCQIHELVQEKANLMKIIHRQNVRIEKIMKQKTHKPKDKQQKNYSKMSTSKKYSSSQAISEGSNLSADENGAHQINEVDESQTFYESSTRATRHKKRRLSFDNNSSSHYTNRNIYLNESKESYLADSFSNQNSNTEDYNQSNHESSQKPEYFESQSSKPSLLSQSLAKPFYLKDLIGVNVRKKFGKIYYYGKVVSYKRPFFMVVYEDDDREEMSRKSVLQHMWNNDIKSSKSNKRTKTGLIRDANAVPSHALLSPSNNISGVHSDNEGEDSKLWFGLTDSEWNGANDNNKNENKDSDSDDIRSIDSFEFGRAGDIHTGDHIYSVDNNDGDVQANHATEASKDDQDEVEFLYWNFLKK